MSTLASTSFSRMADLFDLSAPETPPKSIEVSFCNLSMRYVSDTSFPQGEYRDEALDRRIGQIWRVTSRILSLGEVWNIAESLEKLQVLVLISQKSFLLRKKKGVQNVFSFVVDIERKCFHIFLQKRSSFRFEGTYKKVCCALSVPCDTRCPAFETAHKTNKTVMASCTEVNVAESERRRALFYEEKVVENKYECCPRMLFSTTYTTSLMVQKFCVIEDLYKPVSFFCVRQHSEKEWIQLVKDLVDGLLEVYKNGRFHGDVKMDNALWIDGGRGKWTDFGFSQTFVSKDRQECVLRKQYGSIDCTAPELIDGQVCGEKDILAVEAWAFGFLLYSLLEKRPLWADSLCRQLRAEGAMLPSTKNEMIAGIRGYLSVMNEQVEREGLSLLKDLKKISLRLLCIDKNSRYTMENVKQQLQTIN